MHRLDQQFARDYGMADAILERHAAMCSIPILAAKSAWPFRKFYLPDTQDDAGSLHF